jgi:hypothetical protein
LNEIGRKIPIQETFSYPFLALSAISTGNTRLNVSPSGSPIVLIITSFI